MDNVIDLKAWQLYLGNAFWTLFVGLFLMILAKLLGLVGLDNSGLNQLVQKAGSIAHARDPNLLLHWQQAQQEANNGHPGHYS